MDDLISRQVAIDGIMQFMPNKLKDDATIEERVNYSAWQCAINCAESFVRTMPSAEPQIVRCEECKWLEDKYHCPDRDNIMLLGDFCSWAERRDDETD